MRKAELEELLSDPERKLNVINNHLRRLAQQIPAAIKTVESLKREQKQLYARKKFLLKNQKHEKKPI